MKKANRIKVRQEIETSFPKLVNTDYHALYLNGSRLFGTSQKDSDWDFIAVYDSKYPGTELESDKLDVRIMSKGLFQKWLDRCQNMAIECLFLPEEFVIQQPQELWKKNYSQEQLVEAFMEMAANKWKNAKRTFANSHKSNVRFRSDKKRIHHALRILDFAFQLRTFGRIENYQPMVEVFASLMKNPSTNWEDYEKEWGPFYNQLRTRLESSNLASE